MIRNPEILTHLESAGRRRAANRLWLGLITVSMIAASSCGGNQMGPSGPTAESKSGPPAGAPATGAGDVEQIIKKYRALDEVQSSSQKLRVRIAEEGGKTEEVSLEMDRKREPDGSVVLLVQFLSPPAERDRDALVTVSATGEVQATRYAQSTGGFVTGKSPSDEESLFGMTLQELVGGQPEKYNHKLLGEEEFQGKPVYRVEGSLKPRVDSKFTRMVMLIDKTNYTALLIEAYDSRNALERRLTVDKTQQIDGIWTRMHWKLDNVGRKKNIEFETLSAKYNHSIPESSLSRDHLKKIASK
jgi:hypothetical protein